MIRVASVVVRKGKAYTCVAAQTEAGFYVDSEPVFVVDLHTDEVLAALEKVIALGHPSVPTPTVEEMRKRPGLIPSAAGVSSWKKLAQGGASYSIQWRKDSTITLFISRLDKKGRFEWDPARTRTFAGDTPLRTVVEAILEDVRSRPELMR
jgi:hypothetical protein